MPWFKVDDGFHGHPKVVELTLEAVGLWTLAGSWSAHYLTDGIISTKTVGRLGGSADLAEELVGAGLWNRAGNDYAFRGWAEYQPLKEVVEAERASARARMATARALKLGVQPNTSGTSPEVRKRARRTQPEVRVAPTLPSPPDPPEGEPSRFCMKHPAGTSEPCGPCGDARALHEIWLRIRKAQPTPIPPRGTPSPDTCNHKYVAGYCVRGCEQPEPKAAA